MSIKEIIVRQRDFSAGEINPDALRRDDLEVLKLGVREARNLVSLPTGGLTRRQGRRMLFQELGVNVDFKPFDDVAYTLVFTAGGVSIRTEVGALVTKLAAPWNSTDLDALVIESMDNEVFVAWRSAMRVIRVDKATRVWSISAFQFKTDIAGAVRVPFYRFDDSVNITMQPSALTGVITLTFSGPALSSLHAGTVFRYGGRQVLINAVLSSTTATATVLEKLPPTYQVTVEDGTGFSVGQILETDTTGSKGEVAAVVGNVITMVALYRLITPEVNEKLVSPSASSKITAVNTGSPAPALQWEEQFISDYRGWPRSVSKDRQRLIMANFPQKKNAVFWTAVGDNRDGLIGGDAQDAILEFIGEECQVFHVVGGYDEFAVTDKGVYYIPVSVGAPLQPGSVEFRTIFSSELSDIRPIQVTEGLIFVDKARNGIYAISATGQTARPYIANEINRLHRHLFADVKSIAATSATPDFPARQIYVVNGDGSYVTGQFNADREFVGWLKQEGAGKVLSVAGTYGKVVFMATYTFNNTVVGVAEQMDSSLLCDCAKTISTSDPSDFLELADGRALKFANGQTFSLSAVVAAFYAGRRVSVYGGGFWLGLVDVPADGVLAGYANYSEITLGVDFGFYLSPLFPNLEGGEVIGQGQQKRKIAKMKITVRDTQEFQIGNKILGSYRGGEDTSLPVPERDQTYRYREVGRSDDPEVEIKSTFPGHFKLIELNTRITL